MSGPPKCNGMHQEFNGMHQEYTEFNRIHRMICFSCLADAKLELEYADVCLWVMPCSSRNAVTVFSVSPRYSPLSSVLKLIKVVPAWFWTSGSHFRRICKTVEEDLLGNM